MGIGSPKETGKSFISNARLKANYFSKLSNMVALSDDSGLEIKSLEINPVSTQQGGQKNMEVLIMQ